MMKTKIVEYISVNALDSLSEAQAEIANMRSQYPELRNTSGPGIGLDLAVLKEKIEKAEKLLKLLALK